MARKISTSKSEDAQAAAQSPMSAMLSAPVPSGVEVGAPTRLVDIDLFRFGVVRAVLYGPQQSIVRSVTIDEAGAKKLLSALIRALV